MKRTRHYDVFPLVYDFITTTEYHRQHRIDAVELLHLRAGQTVLDVPCGTGAGFPLLNRGVGRSGQIIGCDCSPGMLARARAKIEKAGWNHVSVIETDARLITHDLLGAPKIDAVISMLGMAVMPDWELVFERTYDLLEPGGRYVMLDFYLEGKRTSRFADAYFKVVANGDATRRFWEPLKAHVLDYEAHEDPCFGGVALTVAGTKPLDCRPSTDTNCREVPRAAWRYRRSAGDG